MFLIFGWGFEMSAFNKSDQREDCVGRGTRVAHFDPVVLIILLPRDGARRVARFCRASDGVKADKAPPTVVSDTKK